MDIVHSSIAAGQRELFRLIVEADACASWERHGARDLAHWLCIRYGISEWKARRWIAAAHALEHLPRLSLAFETGGLGIDKVVELTRFATPETEEDLVIWASRVSGSWIRRKADLAERQSIEETQEALRQRSIGFYFAGPRFHLEDDKGELLRLGRLRRDPSPAMVRLLRLRDVGCTFPGCGTKRFAEAHHIRWWSKGGGTDLENLALICSFHHTLVHEYGWRIRRQ